MGKTILSTTEVISISEGFKYPLTEMPQSCKYFLSSATFMALKSLLFFCIDILTRMIF